MKGTLKFLNIRKGDTVVVLSGKDKGNKGKVIRTVPTAGKVLVEGINMVSKSLRPTQAMPQGKIAKREAPILASKVMLICPSCTSRPGSHIALSRVTSPFARAESATRRSIRCK